MIKQLLNEVEQNIVICQCLADQLLRLRQGNLLICSPLTVILLEPYCGTITEPGLPVIPHEKKLLPA